jgi:hypothetical protein
VASGHSTKKSSSLIPLYDGGQTSAKPSLSKQFDIIQRAAKDAVQVVLRSTIPPKTKRVRVKAVANKLFSPQEILNHHEEQQRRLQEKADEKEAKNLVLQQSREAKRIEKETKLMAKQVAKFFN